MTNPYISVIVTAYNRTEFVYEAIRSILSQSVDRDEYEIIVVSNFPLDADFISSHDIKVVSCDKKGLGIKIRLGLEVARGEVVSILDDDDLWEPEKLAVVSQVFKKRQDIGFFHNWFELIDSNGKRLNTSFRRDVTRRLDAIKSLEVNSKDVTYSQIRLATSYSMDFYSSAISFRRDIVVGRESKIGSIFGCTDVFYFYSCLMSALNLMAVSDRLTNYRIHSSNFSISSSDVGDLIEKRRLHSLTVVEDYKIILDAVSSQFSPALAKAVKWRILGTEIESIWFSSRFSRRHLLRLMGRYLIYISVATLSYDLSVLAYSLLYLVRTDYARRQYLKRYYGN